MRGRRKRRRIEVVGLALLAALACDDEDTALGPVVERPRPPAAPPRPEQAPSPSGRAEPPPPCPAIACAPESFEIRLERAMPWAPGTYYFRASVDGGPRRVCSVVFEPVLGAAHDTCDGSELPFHVQYRYDESEQTISAVSFGRVQAVELTVLTAEEVPPLLQVQHQVNHSYSLGGGGCGSCPAGPDPLTVRVAEPDLADAGSTDAGAGDAGESQADGGALAGDAAP